MGGAPDSSVEVVAYSSSWPESFERERIVLEALAGDVASSIEHIGSTAVPGLSAKPTIDILIVVDSIDAFHGRVRDVEAIGYELRPRNTFVGNETHLFLRKVVDGKRTHHLHVVQSGSSEIDEYRLFRDALCSDPGLATRYEQLKLDLAALQGTDRARYVIEKAAWVDVVLDSLR